MATALTLFIGKSFHSYTELSLFMAEYETYNRQKFWKRSSRKITSAGNIKRYINPELVYYEISYTCIHGGEKFKSRSKGLRKSITFRLGSPCTAYIRLRASPDGQTLDVKGFNDRHNHISIQNRWTVVQVEILIEQYKKYPVLYNSNHEEFSNTDLKNECLINIVETLQPVRLGVTEVDVVSQWNNLMVKYIQAQKVQDTQNNVSTEETQFWYLQKLEFLKEYLSTSDVKLEDTGGEDFDQAEFVEPEIKTVWEDGFEDPLASSSIHVKEEIEESPSGTKLKAVACDSKDENDIFGEFVSAQLKKITDEEERQDAILEIHQVLHKALKKK